MYCHQHKTHRLVEQNKYPRIKPKHIMPTNIQPGHNRKRIVYSIKDVGENWISTFKRKKLDLCVILYTKINLKWIKFLLNVRAQTVKPIEGNRATILLKLALEMKFGGNNQIASSRFTTQ